MKQGLVSSVQRFSTDDGPGIRTTVFFKGCNLQCRWCHNPESMYFERQIQFFSQKCVTCGGCAAVCPLKAQIIKDGQRVFKRDLCELCGRCVDNCHSGALIISGKTMTVAEIMTEIGKDRPFYENSGGGVTFSGGEPLLQKDFLKALLLESNNSGMHTAVDTAGNVSWEDFAGILPYVNLFLYDVKVFNEAKHRMVTGTGNQLIFGNLKRLAGCKAEIWIRIPVIPGINDNVTEMDAIAALIQDLKTVRLTELLPFHRLGEGKYQSLGLTYACQNCLPPAEELMENLAEVFKAKGLPVKKG